MTQFEKLDSSGINRLTTEEYARCPKLPLVLVLDNIRSHYNTGAAFRTADAFRVSRIYLCGICATPPHREIRKTALGADEVVGWAYVKDSLEAVARLKKEGYIIIALEQAKGSTPLRDFQPEANRKYALVLGNEVNGVSREVLDHSDLCLEIPQHGTKHSLNMAVCTGIAVWEVYNKMTAGKG